MHTIIKERNMGLDPRNRQDVRADIVVMRGDRYVQVIDISIINPTAGCYLNNHPQSNLVTESAARNREQFKRNNWWLRKSSGM